MSRHLTMVKEHVPATPAHARVAFAALMDKLGLEHPSVATSDVPSATCPLFVTWHIRRRSGSHLRGCIGSLSPLALPAGVADYALVAAFQDHRFPPIAAKEVPDLEVCVSLLSQYEEGADPLDWAVGTHGIIISFNGDRAREYSAVFLPEVAAEQGWDRETTLQHLVAKAGYPGSWRDVAEAMKLVRFQSSRAEMTYAQFMAPSS
jgi:uncharacterized protein (TIGR00296 family)